MKLEHALVFENAEVTGISGTPTDEDEPKGSLVIQVGLTAELATELGVKDLIYLPNQTVRSVWTKILLAEIVLTDVRVRTPTAHSGCDLAISPKSIAGFTINRSKAGTVKMQFAIRTDGYLPLLGEFLTAVGKGPFRLEIEPLQMPLDLAAAEEQQAEVEEETQPGLEPEAEPVEAEPAEGADEEAWGGVPHEVVRMPTARRHVPPVA